MKIVKKELLKKEKIVFERIQSNTDVPFELRGTVELPTPISEISSFLEVEREVPGDPDPIPGPQGPPGISRYFYGPSEPNIDDIGEDEDFEIGDKWFNNVTETEFTYLPTSEQYDSFFWKETGSVSVITGDFGFPQGPSNTEIENSINFNSLGLVQGNSRKFPVLLNDGSLTFDYIKSSDIIGSFQISSFTSNIPSTNLIGQGKFSLGGRVFSATYTPPSSTIIEASINTNSSGSTGFPLSMDAPGFNSVSCPEGTGIDYPISSTTNNDRSFTLTAKNSEEKTLTRTINIGFRNNIYRGKSSLDLTGGNISSISAILQSANNPFGSFSVNAGQGEKIYYAYPAQYSDVRFFVGGFEGGFELFSVSSNTNSNGFTENYKIFRSINENLGQVTVVVQQ